MLSFGVLCSCVKPTQSQRESGQNTRIPSLTNAIACGCRPHVIALATASHARVVAPMSPPNGHASNDAV